MNKFIKQLRYKFKTKNLTKQVFKNNLLIKFYLYAF